MGSNDSQTVKELVSEGRCLCGAVTLKVIGMDFTDGSKYGYICHCFSCRRSTGTDYAHNLQLRKEQLAIGGEEHLTRFEGVNKRTGVPFTRAFCTGCGSTITSTPDPVAAEGDIIVRMGLFPEIPDPESEKCADEKLEWLRDKIPNF